MQTIDEWRSVQTTLAAALVLVAAGLIASGAVALVLVPLPAASHAGIIGAAGTVLFLLLGLWICGNGAYALGALPYLLACICNGLVLAALTGLAARNPALAQLIELSAFGAAGIFGVLALLASFLPSLFIGVGRFLLAALLVFLAATIGGALMHVKPLPLVLGGGGLLLFCAYLLYDIDAVIEGEVRNPFHAAIGLYLYGFNMVLDFLRALWGLMTADRYRYRDPDDTFWLWGLLDFFRSFFLPY
jgi:FtsH-binding integral membrane protein